MTPQTSKGHFVSLTRNLRHIGRYGALVDLRQYVRNDAFVHSLLLLSPVQREAVLACYAGARKQCESRGPAPVDKNAPRARAKWTELMIARLRKAVQRLGPSDDLVGRELGISRDAARRAIQRYARAQPRMAA
jgi:hypothetical protein